MMEIYLFFFLTPFACLLRMATEAEPMMAAETATPTPAPTTEPVVENMTEAINGTTGKTPATPEGMALAYGSLVIMALVPIFLGAFRSVKSHREQTEEAKKTGEAPETMTQRDAAMFPIIASCALFGLYVFFQVREGRGEKE